MELIKEIEYNRDSSIFKVFVSYYSLNEDPIYRVIENNDHYNSYIKYNDYTLIGEDPRPFILNNERFFISQRYINSIEKMEQNIVHFNTGVLYKYIMNDENFNYGKNWAPFVYNNKLYLIHCFDPFTVISNNDVILKVATDLEKCRSDNFTGYRGGTNGIEYNNYIFGIGHFTPCYDDHTPFIWVIDSKKNTLEIAKLTSYEPKYCLADPTSLWKDNNDIFMSIFESSKGWFNTDVKCLSRIYKLDFEKLYNDMKLESSYKLIEIPLFSN